MKSAPPQSLESSARLFKVFSDPVRLRLLNLLSDGEVCVCHLHEALGLPQPTVSRHLATLRGAGLVIGRRDGLWVFYRLAMPASDLHRSLLCCIGPSLDGADALARDRERLARLRCC